MNTGEDELVAKIAKTLSQGSGRRSAYRRGLALGVGDDAALLTPKPGYETILTCDWFLEGSHFQRHRHPADSIGWKCLARAVSDIAAMGGSPTYFLLSLGLPKTHTGRWLDQFLGGLRRASRQFDCQLAGGDTTRNAKILINVTVLGEVRQGRAVLRSGARAGDLLFVSGRLGEAELGLQRVRRGQTGRRDPYVNKHLYPEPRLALGRWLAEEGIATAMMDLSDGLSTDLARLCAASGVGARVEAHKIPKPNLPVAKTRSQRDLTDLALNGGDDYELLFTVTPRGARHVPSNFKGVPLVQIGELTRERRLVLISPGGRKERLVARGWDPF